MKKYICKMPCESVGAAASWYSSSDDYLGVSKSQALKDGQEGIKNGMGKQYQLIKITYRILPKIYKPKGKLKSKVETEK